MKPFTKQERRAVLDAIKDMLREGIISYNTSLKMRERWTQ